jgi:transcriptional regulator with XRE-family HTH domain
MPRKSALKRTLPPTAVPTAHPRRVTQFDTELGNRIKLRRIETGVSQEDLGKKLGVSFQQVQKYEKGTNRVGAARLQQIAAALGVDETFFYKSNGKSREVETLLAMDAHFSMRLLKAYTSVNDLNVRRLFVSLIEGVAAASNA